MARRDSVLEQLKKRAGKAGLASALALTFVAAPAAANCLDIAASAGSISTNCQQTAENQALPSFKRGIAAFNTARAHLAAAASTSNSSSSYASAVSWIDESYRGLSDSFLMSADRRGLGLSNNDWKKWQAARAGFQYDRSMSMARALLGISTIKPFVATSVCASELDCLNKAIARVESDSVVAPFAPAGNYAGDPRYNEFYFQRAALYSARGELPDADRAIDNYRKILDSARPERKAEASVALEQVALKLANENLARGGISINQAIRYFGIARAARPNSAVANSGLGRSYLAFCRDQASLAAQRLPNCLSASEAFKSALAAPDANQLEAQLGIGEALAVAASQQLILNPSDPSIARYRQDSADAYARAASAGGGNAKAKLELAKALQASQPERAFEAFRDYVGFELSYPDWFAADAASPVSSQFLQRLGSVGGSETRRNIGESILAMYKIRPAPGGVRKDVGVSLLNAALQAQPILADASNELGKLHLVAPVDRLAARAAFNGVIASTGGANGPPVQGREKMRAEAFYQLSQIEAETAGSTTRAGTTPAGLKYARDAFALDSADPRFKKAACIAYIVSFKYSDADRGSDSWCSGISGADGQLLLGMFNLRVAQTAPPAQKSRLRNEARFAFNQGKGLITRSADGLTVAKFESEWRNAPPSMSVASLLEFGIAKADACDRINVRLSLPQDEVTRASNQFDFFQVGLCNG